MTAAASNGSVSLRLPLVGSLLLHALLITAFFVLRPSGSRPMPPVYRVTMIAAPAGERAVGVVQPAPAAAPPTSVVPPRPKTAPAPTPVPTKTKATARTPKQVTPLPVPDTKAPPATKAPTAGGGAVGGHGADVANVNTGGIDFPYPGYLENIVRQIALRFHPSVRGALRAEVTFLIKRDGAVDPASIRLSSRSGVYSFDLEAQGAVEAAAQARAFGPLPAGFTDDVLPVTFRFDPTFIR